MVELLAPVGSIEAFYAAIENGADAIYLGGKQFGARSNNVFSNQEILEIVNYAHLFDKKVYVTVNTIVFDQEIPELIEFLDFLYLNAVDAVIVQDLGVLNILRKRYPDFEVHASTQMNIHSLAQARALKELGVKRIVCAREISLDLIKKIKKEVGIEIEVFVHGSLCVSSSGNCYLSSIIGKRSGNRGRCAQPCRLQYSLNAESGYLLSPRDLYTLPYLGELIAAGIDSLKLEGRMKRPEYVASVVQAYKRGLDNYYLGSDLDLEKEELNLRKIFNRDFTKGFLLKTSDEDYINKVYSNHRGIFVGNVIKSVNRTIEIKLDYKLSKGDSLRLIAPNQLEHSNSFNSEVTKDVITINQMYIKGQLVTEAPAGEIVSLRSHFTNLEGAAVFLTTSSKQISALQASYGELKGKLKIQGIIDLVGDYLRIRLKYRDYFHEEISKVKYEKPKKLAINERILTQFQKTKSTVFEFESLKLKIDKPIFMNIKNINETRRLALENFEKIISKGYPKRQIQEIKFNILPNERITAGMIVKIRTQEQLDEVLKYQVQDIYIANRELYEQVKNIKTKNIYFWEDRISNSEAELTSPLVVNNLGFSKQGRVHSSIYLNITNAYAVNLLENLGVQRIGLSLEMSLENIRDLVENYSKLFSRQPNLEVQVYGRYELMLLKYRLGLTAEDQTRAVELVDRKNFRFPVLLEQDYLKILNSKRLHLIDYLAEFRKMNISQIIDFTIETKEEVREVLDIYLENGKNKLSDVTIGYIKEGVI